MLGWTGEDPGVLLLLGRPGAAASRWVLCVAVAATTRGFLPDGVRGNASWWLLLRHVPKRGRPK